jgi:drug/metabolite transporter (DMT)-like permease
MTKSKNNNFKGASFILISTVAYGLYGVWSRLIGDSFGPFAQNWVRNIGLAIIYLVIILLIPKNWKKIQKKDIKWFLIWTIGGSGSTILTFIAFNNLPLSTTYLLTYASMIFTGIITGTVIYKEKFTLIKLLSVCLSIVGLSIIYSFSIDSNKIIYAVIAVVSGILTGFWNVFSKKISGEYSNSQMLLIDSMISLVIAVIGSLIIRDAVPAFELNMTWLVILAFIITSFVASNALVHGFRFVEAQLGSLLIPTEIIFASIFGYLFFGESLTISLLIGGVCILTASVIMPLFEKSKSHN